MCAQKVRERLVQEGIPSTDHQLNWSCALLSVLFICSLLYLLILSLLIFLLVREGEKHGKRPCKHSLVASRVCPEQGLNAQPLCIGTMLQSTQLPSQGHLWCFY